ncbi:MAG: hypothetical protein JWQ97_997 [Phenylobacterium sp.]|nr:hypothetical protein [Phenylobacterium sp.]
MKDETSIPIRSGGELDTASPMTDKAHLEAVSEAAESFIHACEAALAAGLQLDIDYERNDDEPPRLDIEVCRFIGRRVVTKAKVPNDR